MGVLEVQNVSIRYLTGDFKDIGLKEYVMRKLKKNYHVNEFWADRNITFSLEEGDMLGIIGSNGAGKSTLLKVISGIMEPTEGYVKREGNIAALLELASGFDGDLTVKENTYLRGAMLGYTRQFMDETYSQIIEFAELNDFQDRPFKQLSSGMKSRLAFSIASMVQPEILILDEVLSVGDGAFRKKSEAKMKEIIGGGATTILVSHSLEQILKLCTKVLWLEKGQQIAFGDTKILCNLYQQYLDKTITLEQAKEAWDSLDRHYDYLVVGSGPFGPTSAREAADKGKQCSVIDKRQHLGGNVHCENAEGITVHQYGPHAFHSNDDAAVGASIKRKIFHLTVSSLILTVLSTLCMVNWLNGDITIKSIIISYHFFPYAFFSKFILACFVIWFVIAFAVTGLSCYFRKYPLMGMAFLMFLITVLKYNSFFVETIEGWIRVVWLTDYSYGVVNRGFCGEILSLISKYVFNTNQITDSFLHAVFNCILVICMAITLIWIHCVEKKSTDSKEIHSVMLLWIVSPFFVTFFYTGDHLIGRLDMVLLILFFISLLLICSDKCTWLVFPISICSVLVYQEYTVLFFPFIFILLLAKSVKSKNKKTYLVTACTTIGTIITTLYIVFFGHIKEGVISRQNYYNWIQSRTDADVGSLGVATTYIFGRSSGDITGAIDFDIARYHLFFRFVFLIIICVPVIVFIFYVFLRAFRNRTEWKQRVIYLLMLLSPCLIFLTLKASDILRYWTCFYTAYLNTTVALGIICQDEVSREIKYVEKMFSRKYGKYYLACFCAVMLSAGVVTNSSWPFLELSNNLVAAVDKAVSYVMTNELPFQTYDIASIQGDSIITSDLSTGTTIAEEYLMFEKDFSTLDILIRPVTWLNEYDESLTLHVELENTENRELIERAEISANQLPDNKLFTIHFKDADVSAGTWYCFRFYVSGRDNNNRFCLKRSADGTADSLKHYAKIIDSINPSGNDGQASFDIISTVRGISP